MPKLEAPKTVVAVKNEQMATLAAVDTYLAPLGVKVVCLKCDSPFVGSNADTDRTLSVECRCRELRTTNPRPRIIYSD